MKGLMSALGIVSRVTPVHTAVRYCTRDEGGPFALITAATTFAMQVMLPP